MLRKIGFLFLAVIFTASSAFGQIRYEPSRGNINGNLTVSGSIDWSGGNVIYVPISGNIETYVTNAAAGDTLILASGTYTITDDTDIAKAINIVGQGVGKTTIACATASKNLFHIAAGATLVNISNMSISGTGGSVYAVNASSAVSVNNVDIVVSGAGANYGINTSNSDATIRDCTISATSSNSTASAVYFSNSAAATGANTLNAYNVYAICAGGGGTGSVPFWVYNNNVAQTLTGNLHDCVGVATTSAGGGDYGLFIYSVTTFSAVGNAYSSVFSGADGDVCNTTGDTLNLYDCTFVNNSASGVIGGTMPSMPDKFIVVNTFTSAGINAAIDALGTTGGEVYLPEGDYDCTGTITIDYNNTTLRGSGAGTCLLAANRFTYAVKGVTGNTIAVGDTLTGDTTGYTATVAGIVSNNSVIFYRSLSNAANFNANEVISSSGGGDVEIFGTPTEQNFHVITNSSKTNLTLRDLNIYGGSGGGNANNIYNGASDNNLIFENCKLYYSDNYAIVSASSNGIFSKNYISSCDAGGMSFTGTKSEFLYNFIDALPDYTGTGFTNTGNTVIFKSERGVTPNTAMVGIMFNQGSVFTGNLGGWTKQ